MNKATDTDLEYVTDSDYRSSMDSWTDKALMKNPKFFFPRFFVHTRAMMETTNLSHLGWMDMKRWFIKEKALIRREKMHVFRRPMDLGRITSRIHKDRYLNEKGLFGETTYGAPVKILPKGAHVSQHARLDFIRTPDLKFEYHYKEYPLEKGELAPKDRGTFPHDHPARRISLHSETSSDDTLEKWRKQYFKETPLMEKRLGYSGLVSGKDWFAHHGHRGYRPGFGELLQPDPPAEVWYRNRLPDFSSSATLVSFEEPESVPDELKARKRKSKPRRKTLKPIPRPPPPPPPPVKKPEPPPPIKIRKSKPIKGPNDKDFIWLNARKNVTLPPRRPIPFYVDDVNGTKHHYCKSGLARVFVHKEDFGKIPKYLQERNVELGRPAIPSFRKFYQPHDCKYYHRHTHCKDCKKVHPIDKWGGRMYVSAAQKQCGPYPCPHAEHIYHKNGWI